MPKVTSSESENEEDGPFHSQKPQGSVAERRFPLASPSLPPLLPSPVPAHSPSAVSSSVSSSVPILSTSPAASVSMTMTTATTQSQPVQYVMEEETTTVKVPILRPRPGLLKVVQLGGGVGETFTMGEIIHHVKDYILERTLYDEQDPRIVHCGGDLLGTALKVDSFTIHNAIALFRKNSILEPDSRIRIRRHLVTRAVSSHQPTVTSSGATAYTMAAPITGTETTTSTASSSSVLPPDSSCQLSPDSTRVSQDSEPFSSQTGPSSSALSSFSLSQPSSSCSSSGSAAINFKAAQSSVTVTDSDIERCQGEQVVTSTDSSSDGGGRQRTRGMPRRREGANKSDNHKRKRSTSINVTYDEPDGAAAPWACEVMMETSAGAMAKPEDDTVVVEYDSDTFSVEYDVESDSENEGTNNRQEDPAQSESDVSSSTSGTAFLVVCKESDVEYLADYSDSDNGSDTELTDADKWQCEWCSAKNPPFQRNCAGCWSVRPDWLPSSGTRAESQTKSGSQDSAMSLASCSQENNSSQQMSQESANVNVSHRLEQSCDLKIQNLSKNDVDGGDVKSSPKKRKYSSCLSTSDSQEEKLLKEVVDEGQEDAVAMEAQSDEPRRAGKKKYKPIFSGKDDLCVVCLTRRKTASIIHGKTGHQVCCYRCARRLRKQRTPCPICRRPIQKVIRNFHL